MRKNRKTLALLLVMLLTLPGLAEARSFSEYRLTAVSNEELTAGLSLWQYDLQGKADDILFQRLHVVEYRPGINPALVPLVVSRENRVPVREPVGESMLRLHQQGQVTPLVGLNGDFFDIAAGGGLGLSIRGGKLYMSGEFSGSWSLGFNAQGKALLGQPVLRMALSAKRQGTMLLQAQPIDALNCLRADVPRGGSQPRNAFDARQDNRLVLYTADWEPFTNTQPGGVEVLVELPDALKPTGVLQGTVQAVQRTQPDSTTPAGEPRGMALTAGTAVLSATGEAAPLLEKLQSGDSVIIETGISPEWADIVTCLGGGRPDSGPLLVKDGQLQPEHPEVDDYGYFYPTRHPRTAVGIRRDGTCFFVVAGGYQKKSAEGLTVAELSRLMLDLGAVTALNLDGGPSSTLVVAREGELEQLNSSRAKGQTPVGNSLVFCLLPSGQVGQ
jgi:hypothetical protein